MQLGALGGAALRIAAGELLVDGEGRLAVRRIELGPAPQPQVGVAGAEQRQRRVVGGRELIRRLAELVDGEDVITGLEIALGEVVVDLGDGRIAGLQLEGEPLERLQCLREGAAMEEPARLRQLHLRVRGGARRGRLGEVRMARGEAEDGECRPPATDPDHDGLTPAVSAFPRVLSFSRAFTVIESPRVPPTSAC